MKLSQKYFIGIICFLIAISLVNADENNCYFEKDFIIIVGIGYNKFSFDEFKDYYQDILIKYNYYNIPIYSQKEFPGNYNISGKLLYKIRPWLYIGMNSFYTQTRAFSLYKDYSGNLDIDAYINFYAVESIIQMKYEGRFLINPYIELGIGRFFSNYKINEKLTYDQLTDFNYKFVHDGKGNNFIFDTKIGFEYFINRIVFTTNLGYRIAKLSNQKLELTINESKSTYKSKPFDINLSGFYFLFGAGVSIN